MDLLAQVAQSCSCEVRISLSRVADYIRRVVAHDRDAQPVQVTVADLAGFAETFADLDDREVMSRGYDGRTWTNWFPAINHPDQWQGWQALTVFRRYISSLPAPAGLLPVAFSRDAPMRTV